MPWKIASRSIWDRFWLPKWVPNRGTRAVQTRFLTYISLRSKKRRRLHTLFLPYRHGEDAIWLWKHKCFWRFSLCHCSWYCSSSYHAETSTLASKSFSEVIQNRSKTVFEVTFVLETLPGRVWNDFELPNGFPKEVLEASSRPSKTFSFQLGLPRGLQNGFWKPFGPLGAAILTIFRSNLSLKI